MWLGLNILQEDLEFLNDQLGPRLRAISHKPDKEFNARKAANLKRKKSSSVSPTTSGSSSASTESPVNVDVLEDSEEDEQQEYNEKDEDYVEEKRRQKKVRQDHCSDAKEYFHDTRAYQFFGSV